MKSNSGIPLQYQMLMALVLGAVVGLLVNPGDISLEDTERELTFSIEKAPDGKRVTLVVKDPTGREDFRKSYASLSALTTHYPLLAALSHTTQKQGSITQRVRITDRLVRIIEDVQEISIQYSRKLDGRVVMTTHKAPTADGLAKEFPAWASFYREHGGGWKRRVAVIASFIGKTFLRLLNMVTIPLIVTSLVTGIAGLGKSSRLGAMFGKTLIYYVTTSLLAIMTGILMVNVVRPGVGADLPGGGGVVSGPGEESIGGIFVELINKMVPINPIQSLAGAEFLSIITFSILIGLFIIQTGGKSGETLRNLFQSGFDVMMRMTMFVIHLAPIGVFAFILFATATQGLSVFKTLAWYMLTVFLGLVVHATLTLPLILRLVAKRSPWKYAQAMSPALMTAFSTASSNGTLPLTLNCVEQNAGVSNRVSSFVLPLGATVNMDGTALYEAVAVLFIAQATPGFAVGLQSQILVAITALLASVGAAGIPHAGLVMMAIVLNAVGLPLEAQGIIIAVDRVLDMCRTSVNVWSDSCGCAVLERLERGKDEILK